MNLVFLCSGNGGNFKFIHELSIRSKNPELKKIKINGVITDRNCGAEKYALRNNIPMFRHSFVRTDIEDDKLIDILMQLTPDRIITNVHKMISKKVLDKFPNRFINLHYSILPAFSGHIGMMTVEKAINKGCRFLGATCHQVNENLDDGFILCQGVFPMINSISSPFDHVFKTGCLTLLSGIMASESVNKAPINYLEIMVNPGYLIENHIVDSIFEDLNKIY